MAVFAIINKYCPGFVCLFIVAMITTVYTMFILDFNLIYVLLFSAQTSSTSDLTMIEVHVSDSTQVQPQPVTVNFHSETKENKV